MSATTATDLLPDTFLVSLMARLANEDRLDFVDGEELAPGLSYVTEFADGTHRGNDLSTVVITDEKGTFYGVTYSTPSAYNYELGWDWHADLVSVKLVLPKVRTVVDYVDVV